MFRSSQPNHWQNEPKYALPYQWKIPVLGACQQPYKAWNTPWDFVVGANTYGMTSYTSSLLLYRIYAAMIDLKKATGKTIYKAQYLGHKIMSILSLTCYTVSNIWEHVSPVERVKNGTPGWDQRIAPFTNLKKPSCAIRSCTATYGLCWDVEFVSRQTIAKQGMMTGSKTYNKARENK